jgi:flagellar biosynthesis component FlhA
MDSRVPLRVITLSDEVEECIRKNIIKTNDETKLELNGTLTLKLMEQIAKNEEWCLSHGFKNIPIICRPDIRLYFRRFIEKKFPRIQVISYMEITPDYKLDIVATISFGY